MPITTQYPAVDEQNIEYPFLLISLAISGQPDAGNVKPSVALKCVPYRVENGEIIQHPSKRTFVTQDAFVQAASDPALAQAVTTIMGAVQQFAVDKNL